MPFDGTFTHFNTSKVMVVNIRPSNERHTPTMETISSVILK